MAQIQVSNLTFTYDGSPDSVLENVSFNIDTDWKLGFIGRNGKGKTTFLNLLLGKYDYQGSITTDKVFDYFPYQIDKKDLELTVDELRTFSDVFDEDVYEAISLKTCVEKRVTYGAPSPESMKRFIEQAMAYLK